MGGQEDWGRSLHVVHPPPYPPSPSLLRLLNSRTYVLPSAFPLFLSSSVRGVLGSVRVGRCDRLSTEISTSRPTDRQTGPPRPHDEIARKKAERRRRGGPFRGAQKATATATSVAVADGKTDHFRSGDSFQTNCGGGGDGRQRRPGLERRRPSHNRADAPLSTVTRVVWPPSALLDVSKAPPYHE